MEGVLVELSELYESTIENVQVRFILDNFDCDPSQISKLLGITADEERTKGTYRKVGKNNHEMMNTTNMWIIESKSDSKDINIHFRELFTRLSGKEHLIDKAWDPFFDVLWEGNYLYAGSGPYYERDVITGVANVNAELGQDIYQVDKSE